MLALATEVQKVNPMNDILTIKEVADYLRLSRTTVWRWCNEGKLPGFKVGRGWRVHRSHVQKMVRQTSKEIETRQDFQIQYES